MTIAIALTDLLKDSAYRIDQFKPEHIAALEAGITLKETGQADAPYVTCLVRGKPIKLTPEEVVRQLYLRVLNVDLGYPVSRMAVEHEVTFGREKKRADICIFDKDRPTVPYILVELKKPKLKDGKEQLKSYCNATGAPMGVWTNGQQISYYHRKNPNYFEDIPRIPSVLEKLSDILSERWTIDDLIKHDKLVSERKSLKDLILEMEDEVLANAGVDVFEELFKLTFTKLYDELESGRNRKRHLVFKNYGDTETEIKAKIQDLFERAQEKWEGVFQEGAKIELTPSHLAVCVASLEKVKLFNSNLEVVDDAFEYLINKSSKGEKGQYFTPRYVIDLCVKMLNPQEHETLIDTAAGSCGFPVHAIFHVWERIMKEEGLDKNHLFTTEKKPARCEDYVRDKVFAIDFDEKTVRVGRTLNLIAGDGQTNVLHMNTLDYERWDEKTKDQAWLDVYGEGWKRLRRQRAAKGENRDFQFDILMANPPFAGDIKETRILAKYDLARTVSFDRVNKVDPDDAHIVDVTSREPTFPEALRASHEAIYKMADGTYRKVKIKHQTNVGRDILFIERNLQFLKPGGRMAVVLPQGRFNNASDRTLREYIAEYGRILAVVGLHGNVFKPHTGTKTSVLFVQKWNDDPVKGPLCPKKDDYPIFFATMRDPSKDNSGRKIYRAVRHGLPPEEVADIERLQAKWRALDAEEQNFRGIARKSKLSEEQRQRLEEIATLRAASADEIEKTKIDLDAPILDSHGHLIVKHDLFNHDGLTGDGIAEAFAEFAKKEGLSFFSMTPLDKVRHESLLEGLEAMDLSYVRSSREAFAAGRLDAQFFAPHVEQLLARLGRDGLRLADVASARHERFEPTASGHFDYIEIGSLGADGTATSESVPMAEAPSRATQHVRAGDVITSTVRPIRRLSALIAPEQDGAVCSSGFVVLQPQGISGEVLLTYLRLPQVCELMDLHTSATMYPAISEADLLALPIPSIDSGVQAQVQDAVRLSAHARQHATRLLDAAKRAVEIAIEDSEAAALAHLTAANPPDAAA